MGCGASKTPSANVPSSGRGAGPVGGNASSFPPEGSRPSEPLKNVPNNSLLPTIGSPMGSMSTEEMKQVQSQLDAEMSRMLSTTRARGGASEQEKAKAVKYFEEVDKHYTSTHLEVSDLMPIFEKLGLSMSPEQLEEYTTALLNIADRKKNRKVTKEEFHELYRKISESEELRIKYIKMLQKEVKAVHKEELGAKAAEIFAKYDANGDSRVSVNELKTIMKDSLYLPHLTEVQWDHMVEDALKRGDKNNDGIMDLGEFKNFYVKCLADDDLRAKYQQKLTMRFKDGTWTMS